MSEKGKREAGLHGTETDTCSSVCMKASEQDGSEYSMPLSVSFPGEYLPIFCVSGVSRNVEYDQVLHKGISGCITSSVSAHLCTFGMCMFSTEVQLSAILVFTIAITHV